MRRAENNGKIAHTTQGSTRGKMEEKVKENKFRYVKTKDNLLVFEDDEFKVWNLVIKKKRESK